MELRTIGEATSSNPIRERPFIAVSDLHENSAGKQDDFQKGLFLEFLDAYPPERWDLFILGDWRDFWEDPRGSALLANNEDVERRIAQYRTTVLWGNHDDMPGLPDEAYALETATLFAWHGHQLDPACSGYGTLAQVASFIWGGIERIGLARVFEGLKDRIVRAANRRIVTASKRDEGNEAYAADARTRGKPLYLSGHTHKAELVEWNPGRVYANPGSWTKKGKGYAVTVEGRIVRLLEVVA